MAIAFVQQNQALTDASAASQAVIWAGNTTTGNLIVVTVGSSTTGTGGRVVSITDSQSNVYTQIIENKAISGKGLEVWYAKNITGGVTPTVTATLTSLYRPNMTITEYSGLHTASPVDLACTWLTPSTTTPSFTVPMETSTANELVFVVANNFNNVAITAGTGYSHFQTQTGTTTGGGATEDNVLAARGFPTASMGTGSGQYLFTIVTFADIPMQNIKYNNWASTNNYRFLNASDPAGTGNMSTTEKIR